MKSYIILLLLIFSVVLAGCAGNPNSTVALQCERGLDAGFKELDYAKSKGFAGTVEYTKAASLLSAARVQQEFGKYPNCLEKVKRARAFIRRSKK